MSDNEKKFNTIRLKSSHSYTRPQETITDKLQNPEHYREKLKGYVEVNDIDSVSISTHVRYFIYDNQDKIWKFRTGGLLTKKHPKYVVLSNGKYSWSVQKEVTNTSSQDNSLDNQSDVFETKFFKILSKQEKNEREIEQLKQDNALLAQKLQLILSKLNN